MEQYDRVRVEGTTAERREQMLVWDYVRWMRARGSDVDRLQFPMPGAGSLRCDAYDFTRQNLLEAKGTSDRANIRMAVGELLDYYALCDPPKPRMAILLPSQPDALTTEYVTCVSSILARSASIGLVWKDGERFVDNAYGAFV
jgi:5-methylcytosine-specific restriction protein A